jgi:hypothetical protein
MTDQSNIVKTMTDKFCESTILAENGGEIEKLNHLKVCQIVSQLQNNAMKHNERKGKSWCQIL